MNPDLVLILGCFGLSLTITYLVHCAFRPLLLVHRLNEIRNRLQRELGAWSRTDREADRAAFENLSDFVDLFVEAAPLVSPLEILLARRVLPDGEFDAPTLPPGGDDGGSGPQRRSVLGEAIVRGLSEGAPSPIRDAWAMALTALILHLCASPGSLFLMTIYLFMARHSSDPRRWIVGPLLAWLDGRRLGPIPG